jgi:hypothetical protein
MASVRIPYDDTWLQHLVRIFSRDIQRDSDATREFKVSVSDPFWGSNTRFLLLTVEVLPMWGALSDEKTGLSFVAVIAAHAIYSYSFTCCFMSPKYL